MVNIKETGKKLGCVSALFLCLLFPISVSADVYNIDSIDKLYVTDVHLAKIRIDSLRRRCEANGYKECKRSRLEVVYSLIEMYDHQPALAVRHANNAYGYSEKDKDYGNGLMALQLLIGSELELGFNRLAVYHINKMKTLTEKSPKNVADFYIPESLSSMAIVYSKNKNISKSIEMLDEAMRMTKNTDCEYVFFYGNSLQKAELYMDFKNYRDAEYTCLNILKHLADDSKNQRGGIDKAGYEINYLEVYIQLAIVDFHLKKYDAANEAYMKGMALYTKYPDIPNLQTKIAQYLLLTCQYDKLDKFVEPLINTDIKSKDMLQLMQMLLKSYFHQGYMDKAKRLYDRYIKLDEVIKSRNSDCALEEMNIAYKTYDLQNEINMQKLYIIFASIIVVLLIFIITLSVLYNVKLKRLYRSALARIDEFMQRQAKMDIIQSNLHNDSESESVTAFLQLDKRLKMEKPYLDCMFGRDELSCFAKMDKNKLTDIIKIGAKVTPNTYINQLRIVASIEMLKSKPDYSIESIASDSGFGNRTTFYRVFNDVFGLTPVEYRKSLKSGKLPAFGMRSVSCF